MNINTVYILHTYFTTAISYLANLFLIFLIFKKTPSGMKTYSNVLLQTCIIDLFVSFVACFTMLECETANGRFFIRIAAPWFPKKGYFPCVGIWLFLISLTTVYCCMFIQPLFRYFLIVRNTTLSPKKTWILHVFIIFISAVLSVQYSFSYCLNAEENLNFNAILRNLSPWKFEESLNSFRSQEVTSLTFITYIFALTLISSICNGIYIFCTFKIIKSLKHASPIFSKQTIKMHKEHNRKSLYQMIHPMIALIILLIICAAVVLKFIENSGMLLIGLMCIQYITVLNPVITILTIQSYRNFIFKKKAAVNIVSLSKTGQSVIPIPQPFIVAE